MGYAVPGATKYWNNTFTKFVTNDWHIEGILTFYYGTPLSIGCSANGAPDRILDRHTRPEDCRSAASRTALCSIRRRHPLLRRPCTTTSTFRRSRCRAVNSLGIGNDAADRDLWPRRGEYVDFSLFKQFHVWDGKMLEFRFQAFNALNHFNPSNPNTSLTLNYANGANTNAAFGQLPQPFRRGTELFRCGSHSSASSAGVGHNERAVQRR